MPVYVNCFSIHSTYVVDAPSAAGDADCLQALAASKSPRSQMHRPSISCLMYTASHLDYLKLINDHIIRSSKGSKQRQQRRGKNEFPSS
eukprot:1194268-Prorocentrum_minimum.AAC.1